jgi:hypothetical protein
LFHIVRRTLFDHLKLIFQQLIKLLSTKLLNLNIFPARAFPSHIDQRTVKRLGQWSTRLYLILLSTALAILAIHTIIQPQILRKTFLKPTLEIYTELMNEHQDELQCPCSVISSPYHLFVQVEVELHQVNKYNKRFFCHSFEPKICSSPLVSSELQLNITNILNDNLPIYGERDYRLFLSAHLQFLNGLCQLSIQTINDSIEQFGSSLLITNQLLSEELFQSRIDLITNQTKSNVPTTLNRLLSLLRSTSHGNAFISSYGTNYEYIMLVYNIFQNMLYAQSIIYDNNCSCGLNSSCTIDASFIDTRSWRNVSIKGLKMGCTPSESLFLSTLECFYDISCINLLQQLLLIKSNDNISYILNGTGSQFEMNITVMSLVNELFVENWLTTMNYSSYFDQCSPVLCTYKYIQQLNSIYTIAYLLGLYGGLTIVLKWICPKIIYFLHKIPRCQKKHTNLVQPSSVDIEVKNIETTLTQMNSVNVDHPTGLS